METTTLSAGRGGAPSAYRAALMFRTVGVLMLAVIAAAVIFPEIDALTFSILCLVLMVPALIYQIRLDSTLICTDSAFVDDGEDLYVVIGAFSLGFGRSKKIKKMVKSYRVYWIRAVKRVREFPFGTAVRAEVWTASSKRLSLDEADFHESGAVRQRLEQSGRKKDVLLRLERGVGGDAALERLRNLMG